MAVTTITTVGYGDVLPETESGKIIAITIMLLGIGYVATSRRRSHNSFLPPSAMKICGATMSYWPASKRSMRASRGSKRHFVGRSAVRV